MINRVLVLGPRRRRGGEDGFLRVGRPHVNGSPRASWF